LDLERAMGESVVEGLAMMQATTQDEDVGESKREVSVKEEWAAAEKVVESSTIGKGKQKAEPTRAKVYVEVDGPVSHLFKRHQYALTHILTVRPLFDVEEQPTCVTNQYEWRCKKCQTDKSRCS
jgi:hypothetical protein